MGSIGPFGMTPNPEFEILGTVIGSVPILVMDGLMPHQQPSQNLGHHQSMFQYPSRYTSPVPVPPV